MVIVIIGVIFIIIAQPIRLVMLLILVTLFYSLEIFREKITFWFRFIIMIVMIRGVLVVFSYIARLSPDERFEIKWIGIIVFFLIWFYRKEHWGESESFCSLKLWEESVINVNLFMVRFLLVIIVAVVWVRGWIAGAIRVKYDRNYS